MFNFLIKISPLPKYRALYLKFAFAKVWSHLTFCSLALKGLVYKVLSLYNQWRPYNGRSYFVIPPCHDRVDFIYLVWSTLKNFEQV